MWDECKHLYLHTNINFKQMGNTLDNRASVVVYMYVDITIAIVVSTINSMSMMSMMLILSPLITCITKRGINVQQYIAHAATR
jgi:hypothetical protein